MRYVVILEQSEDGIGACAPDLSGCVAVGETKDEALRLIGEAVGLHLEALREDGMLPFRNPLRAASM